MRLRAANPKRSFKICSHLNHAVPKHVAKKELIVSTRLITEDGPMVYPANAFDSRLRGD